MSGTKRGRSWHHPTGYQMIRSIDIQNFRCFPHLKIDDCHRLNVIVGDNATGKTTLLEALFLALGTTSQLVPRYRQQRGIEGLFSAPARKIEEAVWRDLFHERNWEKPITIELTGDGPEARSVHVFRGKSQVSIPFEGDGHLEEQLRGGISIVWKDSKGEERTATSRVSGGNLSFEDTDEDLPDFFYFSSNQMPGSSENAQRFSDLRLAGSASEFTKIFTSEYDWIDGLSVEVLAGAPVIYATLKGQKEKLPLPNVSGGINRIIGIMLSIASRSRSVVLVDEMENGIYYKHHEAIWRAFLSLLRDYESQLFVTTHSDEWLRALISAAGNKSDDIALWRIEHSKKGKPEVFQFNGETLKAGIEYGTEVRGSAE